MESTLSLARRDLRSETGLFLGYGRGADFNDPSFSDQQKATVDSIVDSGVRQFYFPPPIEGSDSSYDWSFLKPTATLLLPTGKQSIALPDDYGGLEGQATVSASTTQVPWAVDVIGEGRIRVMYAQLPLATGRPLYIAERPLRSSHPTQGQRFELLVYPQPDLDYTLQIQYYLLPDALTTANPYVYGGMSHAETVLESCLAIAEQRLDDAATVHTMKFKERLMASISLDRRFKPQRLGYNADRSDNRHVRRRDLHWMEDVVTVNGVTY